MIGTLMLDEDGDLIAASWQDGAETVGVAVGVPQVAQAVSLAASHKQGAVWWSLSAGIDFDSLFYHANASDAEMSAIRATAMRQAVLGVDGVAGFAGSDTITFTRKGRTLFTTIPCVQIECDQTLATLESFTF